MRQQKLRHKNVYILATLGLILFFLVMMVLYVILSLSFINPLDFLEAFVPLIVFSGFFIFLIGAILLALSIFKKLGGFY
jgi:polyferredoxin